MTAADMAGRQAKALPTTFACPAMSRRTPTASSSGLGDVPALFLSCVRASSAVRRIFSSWRRMSSISFSSLAPSFLASVTSANIRSDLRGGTRLSWPRARWPPSVSRGCARVRPPRPVSGRGPGFAPPAPPGPGRGRFRCGEIRPEIRPCRTAAFFRFSSKNSIRLDSRSRSASNRAAWDLRAYRLSRPCFKDCSRSQASRRFCPTTLFLGVEAGEGVAFGGLGLVETGLDFGLDGEQLPAPVSEVAGRELADALAENPVFFGGARLAGERVFRLGDLGDDVLEADEVLFGVGELVLGLALFVLVIRGSGRLLDQGPFFGRLRGDERPDRALLDDEVLVFGDGFFPEFVLDVLEADDFPVQAVFAFARPENAVADLHFFFGVLEDEGDFGHAHGRALDRAAEDGVLDLLAADRLDPLAAEDPLDGFDDIALAGAVGPDDDGDAGVENDLGPFGKGLEALKLESFDDHRRSGRSGIVFKTTRI